MKDQDVPRWRDGNTKDESWEADAGSPKRGNGRQPWQQAALTRMSVYHNSTSSVGIIESALVLG